MQILIVRQKRVRLGAEKVVVPNAEKREDRRHVALEGLGAEMLVDEMRAVEQLCEVFKANMNGNRD